MRKYLLLTIVWAIGMMVPQQMRAVEVYKQDGLVVDITGKKVTITSSQGGALHYAMYLCSEANDNSGLDDLIAAVSGAGSEIEFHGTFYGDDISILSSREQRLNYSNWSWENTKENCCVQETVDMADAVFKKPIDLTTATGKYKIRANSVEPNYFGRGGLTNAAQDVRPRIELQNGDIGVVGDNFYVYSDEEWTQTDNPVFVSEARMHALVNDGEWYETDAFYYQALNGDGDIITFEYKRDSNNNYAWKALPKGNDNAYDEMTFSYWGTNVKTAISSNHVGADDLWATNLTNNCSSLQNLTLGSGKVTTLGGNTPTTSLTIGANVVELGNGLFRGATFTSLEFISGGTEDLIIRGDCFQRCSNFSAVTIPNRTTLIETGAFDNNSALTTITFEAVSSSSSSKDPLIIKEKAFQNTNNVTDVYVNVVPSKKMMICEYNAFSFDIMVSQTQVMGNHAILHFPKEYFDFYAGDWKKGMSLSKQADLNCFKDGINKTGTDGQVYVQAHTNSNLDEIDGNVTTGLYDTGDPDTEYAPGNGWQQFARSDTGIDIIIPKETKNLMSYSTPVALVKPDWMHLYRITAFTDGFDENSDASSRDEANAANKVATAVEVVVGTSDTPCVPVKTGFIRVDFAEKDILYYFSEYPTSDYKSNWEYSYKEENEGDEDKVNYLKPTSLPDGEDLDIGPTIISNGKITHRIFGFKKIQKTEGDDTYYHGEFLRAKVGTTMKKERAYLCLPATLFHWTNEGGSSNPNNASEDFTDQTSTSTSSAKVSLIFDMEEEAEEEMGIATAVKQAVEEEMYKNDSFYTLQGVKVSKPTTKGVYIHNGKKIFVK